MAEGSVPGRAGASGRARAKARSNGPPSAAASRSCRPPAITSTLPSSRADTTARARWTAAGLGIDADDPSGGADHLRQDREPAEGAAAAVDHVPPSPGRLAPRNAGAGLARRRARRRAEAAGGFDRAVVSVPVHPRCDLFGHARLPARTLFSGSYPASAGRGRLSARDRASGGSLYAHHRLPRGHRPPMTSFCVVRVTFRLCGTR